MKIAFLSYFNGLNFRGAETFVHELGNHLADLKHEVKVYQYGPEMKNTRYQVGSLAAKSSLPDLFYPSPDIIFPVNGRLQAFRAKFWSYRNDKKIVISGQSGPGWDDRLNLYTFPDAFIGLTDYQCSWAKNINPSVKIVKIPNGVDTQLFHPGVSPLTHNLTPPVVLYVAAFDPIKRHELLVRAVAKTRASLLLVGNGEPSAELNELCRKLIPGRFRIMTLTHSEMPSVYTACNIFTYPTSSWESFGIAILEAMASGLPVVAADDPVRREIVGNAGMFVDPTDTEEYAHVLEKALTEKWDNKPVIKAAFYDWDKIALEYSDLFTDLTKI